MYSFINFLYSFFNSYVFNNFLIKILINQFKFINTIIKINLFINILFILYSYLIKQAIKNISGNNMYLSAIVIFGKEISPWWIAGGGGTGVVVAGVIIYMRNHKDDDPNFKIPKIKNPIIREPVKSANSSVKPEQITGDNYTNALRNYEQIKINKINVLNTYEEIKAFNIKEYIKPKEDLITLNNSKLKLIENRIDELKDLSNINNDLKFEIELLEIKYQKRLDSAFTNLKNAEVNLKEAFKLIPPEMQASESVDKIFCEVVTEPVVAQG